MGIGGKLDIICVGWVSLGGDGEFLTRKCRKPWRASGIFVEELEF
jgi:hypothetical protein